MTQEEVALRIFTAFLARDPLAAQRFTEIGHRLEQLAGLSQQAAAIFLATNEAWVQNQTKAQAIAQRIWDYHSQAAPEIPVPEKLRGAAATTRPREFTAAERDLALFADLDISSPRPSR